MAIDPLTAKIILTQVLNNISDEEKRNRLIITIVIISTISLLVVMIPIYILTNPIEAIKLIITDNLEYGIIEEIKNTYPMELQRGELTYKGRFPFPLEHADKTYVTSIYGYRLHPITGKSDKHTGIDLSGIHHDNVLSIADGEVSFSGVQRGYGNCIEIKHNINGEEFYSFYAHLSKINVVNNQQVLQGDIIALEGGDPITDLNAGTSTGHHLHFEIRKSSVYGSDINPTGYIFE